MPHDLEILAAVLLGSAIVHTFSVKVFHNLAGKFPPNSLGRTLCHLLGEVEIVFGFWGMVLILCIQMKTDSGGAARYLGGLSFQEPLFVFVIMVVAATRPVVHFASSFVTILARAIPLPREAALYFTTLFVAPLLGSLITEPAAMTVTALILKERFFDRGLPQRLKYFTLAVLFVNVSVGGVLTDFAAPPVLMVARIWQWDLTFMLTHFGWKAVIATAINALGITFFFLRGSRAATKEWRAKQGPPSWLTGIHLVALSAVVWAAHHAEALLGILVAFIALTLITKRYQQKIKYRESALVAFFLAGLVVLGGLQGWWLAPLITSLKAGPLFFGATLLTAFTDNAALTFLGAQVPNLSAELKYALVAGAVAGGGLTVIANAPNPAGLAILSPTFGKEGVNPFRLLLCAIPFTIVAMLCLWVLP